MAHHYNTNPQIAQKRKVMKEWTDWLDKLAAEAVAADPDQPRSHERTIYRRRNGNNAWKAAIDSAKGPPLSWSDAAISLEKARTAKPWKDRVHLSTFAAE